MNTIEKRKIEKDCANAPVSNTANELGKLVKSKEDLWFRLHETELMEAARARRKTHT